MTVPTYKIVLIVWRDSTSAHSWQRKKEGVATWDELVTKSVGWLVDETEQTVTISSSIGAGDDEGIMCPLTIPRFAIESMHTGTLRR